MTARVAPRFGGFIDSHLLIAGIRQEFEFEILKLRSFDLESCINSGFSSLRVTQ